MTKFKLPPEVKARGVQALRDWQGEQAYGKLIDSSYDGQPLCACALGVFLLAQPEIEVDESGICLRTKGHNDANATHIPRVYAERLGSRPGLVIVADQLPSHLSSISYPLEGKHAVNLTDLNDALELPFSEIADLIEAHL